MLIVLMVLPIPTLLLDALFVFNIGLSIAILMTAMNAAKPLDFSAFPSVLLFATLLRLALNVASTRIVLVSGHEGEAAAGQVIESFAAFLIAGNFAVGLFVFIILLIINMVVITKGAGRVSEVSARFTLDAMPGKQMAIDADIAAGLMSPDEARRRRAEVATEADFYGAMDGSSKFVKGDAIAGLLILGINIIAGFCLGMISHGLSAGEAAEVYVTLAVGDALVAQVPALLLSIAAAMIVTRVADKDDLAGQIGGQFADPRSWLPVAGVLLAMGCIPAMPQTIFLPAGAFAFWLYRTLRKRAERPAPVEEAESISPEKIGIEEVSDQTLVTIELGYGLVHLVNEARGSPLVSRITGVRKQLSQEFGFVVPRFRLRDSFTVAPNDYRILLGGIPVGAATLRPDRLLAIDTGDAGQHHGLSGDAAVDPSFGCPALWIAPQERDHAIAEGFLAVDPGTVIATHLNHLLRQRGPSLLGPEEVRALLDAVRNQSPGLVEALTPDPLSLAALTRLLRTLLADGITLGHPLPILSSIALALQITQDFDRVVDRVRADLGEWLVAQVCAPGETLPVLTLAAELEAAILAGPREPVTGHPVLEAHHAQAIGRQVAEIADRLAQGRSPALVVQPPVRRVVADLLRTRAPGCLVISIAELPPRQAVEIIATVSAVASDANPPATRPGQEVLPA
ncbi:flagellar biosynthesis protein FlhA [Porphyrobacter sp. GA68]|nr:flagellar biosynthesis protein FlhA [Porphyrobacter sp. GA68]